jgi:hypothetical protein
VGSYCLWQHLQVHPSEQLRFYFLVRLFFFQALILFLINS